MKIATFQKRLLLMAVALIFSFSAFSQNAIANRAQLSTSQVLLINNLPVQTSNLTYSDALGANGAMTHTVSFNFNLIQEDPGLSALLTALQKKNIKETRSEWSFSILNIDFDHRIIEQRTYSAITIQEFSLSPLDATQSTPVKANVRLTAANMQVGPGIGKADYAFAKSRPALSNLYKLTLGTLPTVRVSLISSLMIMPVTPNGVNFTINVSGPDALAWNQAFLNGSANNLQGNIQLLSPDNKNAIKTITITDAKITSSTGGGGNSKATVVVNARMVGIL